MSQDWQIYSLSAIVVTVLAVGAGAFVIFKKKRGKEVLLKPKSEKQQVRPEKLVGKVAKLIVYPIKSCQGVIVEEATITTAGLKCN